MEQQISDPDAVDDEEEAKEQTQEATEEPDEERSELGKQLSTLLATNSVESLDVGVLEANIGDVEDVELLEKAAKIEERDDALELYEGRINDLKEAEAEEDGARPPHPEDIETESEEEDAEEPQDAPEDDDAEEDASPNPFDSGGEEAGDDAEEEATSEADPEEETEPEIPDDATEIEDDEIEVTDDDVAEAVESADPVTDTPTPKADGNGSIAVKDIAPNAMTVTEAAEQERRWTTMVWAEPGMGKSHFSMSAESPVCVIDTEGKADELAHKFADEGEFDDPFIFQPSDFDEAKEALEQSLTLLDAFREEHGVVGTIAVDSMSVMWGWSQQKYVDKFYPHAEDPSEVELSTGFGSGKSDWKQIKNYHNVQFRQKMIDSPYHLVWTAMSEDDYDAQINENRRDAEKPAGEKENVYKVDEVIRLKEGPDGAPVGELQKSGKVKHRYTGLRYPTFPKHQELIEAIDDAEAGNGSIAQVEAKFGVNVVEGNPAYVQQDDDE